MIAPQGRIPCAIIDASDRTAEHADVAIGHGLLLRCWQGGLWDTLTAREHIEIYAGIKCLPEREIKSRATVVLTALDMLKHADKQVKELSGGTFVVTEHLHR